MKLISAFAVLTTSSLLTIAQANTAVKYELTITNGSNMPISPVAVYVVNGQEAKTQIGKTPSQGLIQLCQTGNLTLRLDELSGDRDVTATTKTQGLTFPGQSQTVEISVDNVRNQSIHFEGMYGKTKDACAIGSVGSHSLYALKSHVTSQIIERDSAIQTGAFLSPSIPTYLENENLCPEANDAVSCLRTLAHENTGDKKVQFFSPLLPSVISHLEDKYGAEDVQTLVFPAAGAVQFSLKLKH